MTIYYFHGGAPDLLQGGVILPPSVTGARSTTLESQVGTLDDSIAQRPDKVYITTRLDLARMYAALWTKPDSEEPTGGSVYEVEVQDGSMGPDPDLLSSEGMSFQADSAVILRIQDAKVAFDSKRVWKTARKVMQEHKRAKAAAAVSPDPDSDSPDQGKQLPPACE